MSILFSKTGNCTPLQCLARRKRGPDALRDQASNDALVSIRHSPCPQSPVLRTAQDHNNGHACTSRPNMEIALRFCVRCSTLTQSARCPRCGTHGVRHSSFLRWDDRHRLPRLDSRPWRSPRRNSVPCSVISPRNGVSVRSALTLPFGPCIIRFKYELIDSYTSRILRRPLSTTGR